jgi:hypothetical protein
MLKIGPGNSSAAVIFVSVGVCVTVLHLLPLLLPAAAAAAECCSCSNNKASVVVQLKAPSVRIWQLFWRGSLRLRAISAPYCTVASIHLQPPLPLLPLQATIQATACLTGDVHALLL